MLSFIGMPVAAAATILLLAHGASAQTPQQQKNCNDTAPISYQQKIEACTALLRSGRYSGKNLASVHLIRGNAYKAILQRELAIADFTSAIKYNPPNADALYNRGLIHNEKLDYENAIRDFSESITIDPQADAFSDRAKSYFEQGQFERAIQDYNQAISVNPKYVLAYLGRALTQKKLGRDDLSEKDYRQAAQVDPNYGKVLYARSVEKRKNGDTRGAEEDLFAARVWDPNFGR